MAVWDFSYIPHAEDTSLARAQLSTQPPTSACPILFSFLSFMSLVLCSLRWSSTSGEVFTMRTSLQLKQEKASSSSTLDNRLNCGRVAPATYPYRRSKIMGVTAAACESATEFQIVSHITITGSLRNVNFTMKHHYFAITIWTVSTTM